MAHTVIPQIEAKANELAAKILQGAYLGRLHGTFERNE